MSQPLSVHAAVQKKSNSQPKTKELIAASIVKVNGLYSALKLTISDGKLTRIEAGDATMKALAVEDLKKINVYEFFKPAEEDYETNIPGVELVPLSFDQYHTGLKK